MPRPRFLLPLPLFLLLAGCGETAPTADQVVPMEAVPAPVVDAAKKALPGFKFDTAYKLTIDGRHGYELRGKDARGKIREVELSESGKVLAVE